MFCFAYLLRRKAMYSIIGLKPQKSFTDSWLTPIAELNFLITLLAHLDEPKVSITNRRDS